MVDDSNWDKFRALTIDAIGAEGVLALAMAVKLLSSEHEVVVEYRNLQSQYYAGTDCRTIAEQLSKLHQSLEGRLPKSARIEYERIMDLRKTKGGGRC